MDAARVTELYVPAGPGRGGLVGSGYRIGPQTVLTAAHVVAALPVWAAGQAVPDDVDAPGACRARPLGQPAWTPAVVAWRDDDRDLAVLGLSAAAPDLPDGTAPPRWGRADGTEQIAVNAVGFPWAQERADRIRDTEQLFGFIAPAAMAKSGLSAVSVVSSPPAGRAGASPWAGMSGAALFAGPFLVGVVVVDPARFGADRVVAAPIAPLAGDAQLAGLLGTTAGQFVGVGPRLRLAVSADVSVALVPPYRPVTDGLGREPGRLLLPEYGIVPFGGYESDLETLEEWCRAGPAPALRIITGAGGSGKTRLAAEACVRMARHGWQAGFADPDAPGGQAQLDFDQPTLLVVDDADLNVPLLANLMRTAGNWAAGAPPLRILLLARHTTGWWDTLNQRTDRLPRELAGPELMLHDGSLAPAERAEHHARALRAFTAWLSHAAGPAEPATPPLADPAFASPLLVHMHALLTACGAEVSTTDTEVRQRILDAVLDRERDRWRRTFPASLPSGGARTYHQAVTVATLLSQPSDTATAGTLAVIGEFSPAAAAGARAAVSAWLHELYPGADPPWTAPVRPDPLAEQLLASCPQLSDLVLAGYAVIDQPEQLEQVLAELTRAGGRQAVRDALARLLDTHLPDLLAAAVRAPAGRLPDLLDLALTLIPRPAAAAALAGRLPGRSTGLAAFAATLARQAVDHHREQAAAGRDLTAPDLAGSLNELSVRLADLGRREDALAAIEEAVEVYRRLAGEQPGLYQPGLAVALDNLSSRLAALGQPEDALTAVEEAVALRRPLAAAQPGASAPDLAMSLSKLSVRLADLGRREDALAAIEEAAGAYRELAAAEPETFEPDLAMVLDNLSGRLAGLGRRDDALDAVSEAVALRRKLAAERPDAFRPDLAGSLNNWSNRLAELRQRAGALAAIEEAVEVYRQLAGVRPEAFNPDLAMSLSNRAGRLADLGRAADALAAIQEAVEVYRQLAGARPAAFTSRLAGALNNLSSALGAAGRPQDALAAIEEAVEVYRQLAGTRPEAFSPELAGSLNNLSLWLADLGRAEDARAAIEEAVQVYRLLAAARPGAFSPDLAMALGNQSSRLADLQRGDEALAAIEEAVRLYRTLAGAPPAAFAADLAGSLLAYRSRLAELGRRRDAVTAGREALAVLRGLDAEQAAALHDDLVDALRSQVTDVRALGPAEEADHLERELAALIAAGPRPAGWGPGRRG
ncbi:MAG TPA: tetratricopeptide repeat-containing serine protease family protein [Streptosporangiaceae bacterium]